MRRDLVQQRAEQPAHLRQVCLVVPVGVRVGAGEPGDLGVPRHRVRGQPQRAPVGTGREVGPLRVDVVTVLLQPQVANEIGRQQGHHVRQRGDRVVRPKRVLADRGTAGHVPALAHQGVQPAAGQVRGGDQAVVPAADHDRIPAPH